MKALLQARNGMVRAAAPLAAAAALALLAGCGQLNDDPAGGATVGLAFPGTLGGSGGAGTYNVWPSGPDTEDVELKTVVAGAIVITHRDTPYTSETEVTNTTNKEAIEDDAIQSARYFEVVQRGEPGTVSFLLPPNSAGPWQIIAVGLRYRIKSVSEVADLPVDAPIWYGFSTNGGDFYRSIGDVPDEPIVIDMQVACAYTENGLSNDPDSFCFSAF